MLWNGKTVIVTLQYWYRRRIGQLPRRLSDPAAIGLLQNNNTGGDRLNQGKPGFVPEGYTYQRCDHFTPAQFIKSFPDDYLLRSYAKTYVSEHRKTTYSIDDQIEVWRMLNTIHPLPRGTTKIYEDPRDARRELHNGYEW